MVLIARDNHLSQLSTLLQESFKGQFEVAFITGEAGSGKTVLIKEFIQQVKIRYPEVLFTRSKCYEVAGGGQEPYLPFVEILDQITKENKGNKKWDVLREAISDLGPDWIQLVPGAGGVISALWRTSQWGRRKFNDQGEGVDLQRHMVQFTRILRLVSENLPLIIWIDDLHWSDHATLDLIAFLADQIADARILMLLCYRPTDIGKLIDGKPHPVKRLKSRLERYTRCTKIPVDNFSLNETKEFLWSTKHNFSDNFSDRIWRQSGGNPLFIKEFIVLLHKLDRIKRKDGDYVLAQSEIEIDIPNTIQSVIKQRLDLIDLDLRRLLDFASVQGESFASRILAQLLQAPELDILEKLNLLDKFHRLIQELEKQNLIYKIGTEYQFVHVLIQQYLYNGLSTGQRKVLHLAIGSELERLYGNMAKTLAIDLAVHFERGGDYLKAARYYLQGSQSFVDIFALDDAIRWANAARSLAKNHIDQGMQQEEIKALALLAESYFWKAEYDLVINLCMEGEAVCEEYSKPELLPVFLYRRARINHLKNLRDEALKLSQSALHILGDMPEDKKLQGRILNEIGSLFSFIPIEEAKSALDRALQIAEQNGFQEIEVQALITKTWIAINRDFDSAQALALAEKAFDISTSNNFVYDQVTTCRLIAFACRRLGLGERALEYNQRAVELSQKSGLPRSQHMALYSLAISFRTINEDWQKCLELVLESIEISEKYQFPPSVDVYSTWFKTALGLGLWEEAEKAQKHFIDHNQNCDNRSKAFYYRKQGNLFYARGKFDEALAMYQRAYDLFFTINPESKTHLATLIPIAKTFLAKREIQKGKELLQEFFASWKGKYDRRFSDYLWGMGRAYLLSGNIEDAIHYLRQAVEIGEKVFDVGIWPVGPLASLDLSKCLMEKSEFGEALTLAINSYNKLKKWEHHSLGEAAFVLAQVYHSTGKREETLKFLDEARNEWNRLELTFHLPQYETFVALL